MDKEPEELIELRSLLANFEKNQNTPQGSQSLAQAIDILSDLIEGNFTKVCKERGKRLLIIHGEKMLSRAKSILSNPDPHDPNDLRLLYNVMKQFNDSGFFDDEEYEKCKTQLYLVAFEKYYVQGRSEKEIDQLLKELEKLRK